MPLRHKSAQKRARQTKTRTEYNKHYKAKLKTAFEAKAQADLNYRATKLGVDITGLSIQDARAKLDQAEAAKLGVDVTGLSNQEARIKIQGARAAKLGIDITGLSTQDAAAKIQAAYQARKEASQDKNTATATITA